MKKLVVLILLIVWTIGNSAMSQRRINTGDIYLNGGLSSTLGPYAGIDLGIKQNITIGATAGVNFLYQGGFFILGKGNFHVNEIFDFENEFDVYGGGTMGYLKGPFCAAQVGGRYEIDKKWDLHAEISGGLLYQKVLGPYMYIQVGISRKLF